MMRDRDLSSRRLYESRILLVEIGIMLSKRSSTKGCKGSREIESSRVGGALGFASDSNLH